MEEPENQCENLWILAEQNRLIKGDEKQTEQLAQCNAWQERAERIDDMLEGMGFGDDA